MEQFSDLIKNRRSMRKFTDQELTQEEVVALLKAALMAPSSKRHICNDMFKSTENKSSDEKPNIKDLSKSALLLADTSYKNRKGYKQCTEESKYCQADRRVCKLWNYNLFNPT